MNWRPLLLFLARLAYAALQVITAIYCLLAYIPFTYQQVHVGGLLPWLTTFVRIHPYLYVVGLAVVAPTILPDLRERRSRILTWALAAASVLAAIGLFIHPVLANLKNDGTSLGWSLAALAPLVWLSACDWLANGPAIQWQERENGEQSPLFLAALFSAMFCSGIYALALYVHTSATHAAHFPARQLAWSVLWSVASHLVVFLGAFIALILGVEVAALVPGRSAKVYIPAGIALAVLWLVFRTLVFAPLSFRGWVADGMACALGLAIVAFFTGTHAMLCRTSQESVAGGIELLFWPVHFLREWRTAFRAGFFVALAIVTYWLATATVAFDWEYLLQHLVAVAVWIATFAAFYVISRREPSLHPLLGYGVAALALACYAGLQHAEPRRQEDTAIAGGEVASMVDEYANYDVSFRLADQMLAGTGHANASDSETAAFYSFLAANTDVPHSRQVAPVDIDLVKTFARPAGPRPNIFVFVIDSLRRDYLGAYNHDVNFTPAFDAFAHDSVVMQNAFTHYGGTGLSEPSIWVGGMMLHKQYITPFVPMNTLKKLVDAEDYDAYVSKDTILQTVLGPSPEIHELDAGIGTMSYDFCRTLSELSGKLPPAAGKPIFAYTQPQNIHISVIDREGRSVPPGENYPSGFNPPYASRVAHMDACFGHFIDQLKKTGQYDNSIIVVTADHGDSLGERGRWGHAYTLFPEVVQVPLLIHLPASMRSSLAVDPKAIAFLTDITPTLYYLLGEKPVSDPILGRPLFTAQASEQDAYARDAYLVVSSYAPVYGVLDREGRTLYIADGVNYRDYYYDLADGRSTSKPISDELRRNSQARIRKLVLQIGRFYHFGQ